MTSWKRDFGSGLIVLTPLLVTVIFLAWIYSYLATVPVPVESGPVRVMLTLLIFVLLVFSVGYLMRTAMGAVLEQSLDRLMNHLPGLRVIYNASKMAVETALTGAGDLQTPVRLEVWDGLRMTAFKTGNKTADGRDILFLPTAPNITSGFVIEVEEDRYTDIEDNMEDALTRILSAGFGNNDEETIGDIFDSGGGRLDSQEVSVDDVGGDIETDGDSQADGNESGGATEAESTGDGTGSSEKGE